MKTRKSLLHILSLVVLASLVLTACGGGAATDAPASSGDALYDAAKAEGMLTTIALPLDWCSYGAMYEGFKAKYPGIEINPLDPGAGSAEELEAIKANKDNPGPQAPDVVDIGIGLAPGAKEEGLFQPYKVSTWNDIPEGAKDAEGYWYGDYYGVLALEVNTAEVANPPAEYADLLKPEYNGQVALSGDPLTSNAAALSVWAAGLSTGATGPEAENVEWCAYWTTGRQGLASWPRVAAELKGRGYDGVVCLTAEYSDEASVDRLIAEDLAFARSLFA